MGVTPKWTKADIDRRFDNFLEKVEKRIVSRFKYLGEMCVKHAREVPASVGFTDQSGALRSSIGYVIFKDGTAIHSNYSVVGGGSEGVSAGMALARKVGAKYKGYALVVTAGMNYAIKLESRGRDVLTSAEIMAKQEFPRIMQELKDNINKSLS